MTPIGDLFRKGVSLGIALFMLGSSIAVPLLDSGELTSRTVAESQHEPGSCATGHDHKICTQVGANAAAPADAPEHRTASALLASWTPDRTPTVHTSAFPDGHPARAPPRT